MQQGRDVRGLTSLATIGVTSALSSGAVMKPNQSRSLGGGGTQAHTVPCNECMSTCICKCILHTQTHQGHLCMLHLELRMFTSAGSILLPAQV